MPRPTREFPVPKLRTVNGHFKMRWYADGTPYQISLGAIAKGKAQAICTASGAAFAGCAEFPDEIRDEPALKRYLLTKNNVTPNTDDESLIAHYIGHMRANSDSDWPMSVKGHLKRALEFLGSLHQIDSHNIHSYLDHVASSRSNATRNRCAAALGGFYRWMRKTGQHPKHFNPMADIAQLREARPPDGIVIWEQNEVKALLSAADKRRDGIAVWVAILAGLRRSEIARLKWSDVTPAYILVTKSKTGVKRQVPLSSALSIRLEKESHSRSRVVPWPEKANGWQEAARKMTETYLPRMLPKIQKAHPEKFGWNAFRHTFASRHAQVGHSLDIIAAWLGDSPKVCKEHYARYVPRNTRDSRIDAADPM